MNTSHTHIEVGTFLQNPQPTKGGFVYRVEELLGDSRTKVAVFPYGKAKENNPDIEPGEITDITTSMAHSLEKITESKARTILGRTLQ